MSYSKLENDVIKVGLCTDCGNCVAVCPDKCLVMNYEEELPQLVHKCATDCELCYESCPGKDIPMPELERVVFGRERNADETTKSGEEWLGISQGFINCYAADPVVRANGAGGGFISALLIYALENDLIDGAVVVGMNKEQPWRIEPKIVTNREGVLATASTKDSLVPVNAILGEAVERGFKRLGFVGLPCHVHAIRKMQLYGRPTKILETIKFVIGLVCGTNFSYQITEHVIEDVLKVPLTQVAKVEFRAGEYPGIFMVTTKDGKIVGRRTSHARGLDDEQGSGVSPRSRRGIDCDRCIMCYDYANDLADVSVGDYWGLEMTRGVPGLSAAILRTDMGQKLVSNAEKARYVCTAPTGSDNFYMGSFEQKKHAFVIHTLKRREHGWQTPDFHMPLVYPKPMPRKLSLTHPLVA